MEKEMEMLQNYLEELVDEFDHPIVYAIWEALEEREEPTFSEVRDIFEKSRFIFYHDMDLEDVAIEIIRDTTNFPRDWEKYLDLPKMASDLEDDGYIETNYGTIYLE
jgi:hypothetical protein